MFEWIISGLQTITVKDVFYGICTIVPGVIALYIAYKSNKEQSELTNEILEKATRPFLIPTITWTRLEKGEDEQSNKKYVYYVKYNISNFGKSVALLKNVTFNPTLYSGNSFYDIRKNSPAKIPEVTGLLPEKSIEFEGYRSFDEPMSTIAVELTISYDSTVHHYEEIWIIEESSKSVKRKS